MLSPTKSALALKMGLSTHAVYVLMPWSSDHSFQSSTTFIRSFIDWPLFMLQPQPSTLPRVGISPCAWVSELSDKLAAAMNVMTCCFIVSPFICVYCVLSGRAGSGPLDASR